ncbi:MAG: glycosyltransferase [Bacilli bacterium]|nr:glycosyltransferase [Bacilli bacterium]MBR2711486.1 glycosyltransferase [Bacilli bacterium]
MYTNVFYIPHFNIIGGIETYIYELAKKYSKYDITVVYSDGDYKQISRLAKYVRVIKYNGEKIKCKRLFIMYRCNLDIFEAEHIIQITHADYKAQNLTPNKDPRINEHYAVSKAVAKTYEEISGLETKVCYNPLSVDKPKKVLRLISATRLTKEKGKDRMTILANALTKANIPFLWLVFTNSQDKIDNPNVIYMNPRLDIRDFIAGSDYLVQLSDTEAWSYSVLESLVLSTPVIVTQIPCFIEMGIKSGVNGYVLPFNMKDIPINEIYNNIPEFTFKAPKDIYDKLLIKEPSTYDPSKKVDAICIKSYTDLEHNYHYKRNDKVKNITIERYEYLKGLGLVE